MPDPSTSPRSRAWVEVRLDRLRANLFAVQRTVGAEVGLIPMVKADAYGLGVQPVTDAIVEALAPEGPWAFGVATVSEGEVLRNNGWAGRLLVFSPAPPEEYVRAAHAGLTLCLSSVDAVERWAGAAERLGQRLAFHTEVDTGMGRSGFPAARAGQWGVEVEQAARRHLHWEGAFTHFHSADEPDLAATDAQWALFQEAVAKLPPAPSGEWRVIHAANSAASVRRAGYGADLVRPGIFLYGGNIGPGARPEPVVSVRSRVAHVRAVQPGATVGYGATYTARRPERWGTLAIGYGDGLPRALGPAGGAAIVRGQRVPIVGRISMDVATVDLSRVPDAREGDVATLIGRDGTASITVDEVADRCGTISYEILTGLTSRLPRVYRAEDAVSSDLVEPSTPS